MLPLNDTVFAVTVDEKLICLCYSADKGKEMCQDYLLRNHPKWKTTWEQTESGWSNGLGRVDAFKVL